ncbi:kinase-like protein [Trichodelitschia bisporula]|uniref:non-specific serine/threonine protein kinase n=1 Tax=Trichodelitschia bisporula TaxID=703511 RepID=A0A6G1HS34_9PEZI|nr:kinase-like protein [Trichodelitschia bisporula]
MGNSNGKPVVFTDQVNLNHFKLLRVVGKGAFGKVRIVERKDSGDQFALKYIRKDEVVRSESVRNIIRERRMLESLRHPFLCNLRYSFQDVEYLYLVVDLMTGGDLRFHISRKTFTEEAVRFWIAQLGCALRYIHTQGIVHRDVKPDNILLDRDGHVHLADFNVASDFKPDRLLTSKSGTLAYLAPEVYEGKGYSCEVDWWSLGVVFYECIYNKRPFEAPNHEQLGQKILKGEPIFPVTNPPVSMVCLHAISSLLEKDRKQRIGAIGFQTFYDNPFFRPLDFAALERKEIEPIFKPSSEKTNFDATYDLEELLLEEAPLEARARRQKPREQLRDDATDAEIRADELHRMIEKLFEPFDYTLVAPENAGAQDSDHLSPASTSGSNFPVSLSAPNSADGNLQAGGTPMQGRSRSSTQSPNGSPPLPTVNFDLFAKPGTAMTTNAAVDANSNANAASTPNHTNPNPVYPHEPIPRSVPEEYDTTQTGHKRRRGVTRNISAGGGTQHVLHAEGPWSDLDRTLAAARFVQTSGGTTSSEERDGKRPSGMLGFLSRKKGRDRSPKAKEPGVIGKEGARVIISNC